MRSECDTSRAPTPDALLRIDMELPWASRAINSATRNPCNRLCPQIDFDRDAGFGCHANLSLSWSPTYAASHRWLDRPAGREVAYFSSASNRANNAPKSSRPPTGFPHRARSPRWPDAETASQPGLDVIGLQVFFHGGYGSRSHFEFGCSTRSLVGGDHATPVQQPRSVLICLRDFSPPE